MSRHAAKLLSRYRTLGLWLVLAWLLGRFVTAIYRRHRELLLLKRLAPHVDGRHQDGDLRIEAITPEHDQLLREFNARYRTPQKVAASAAYLRNGYSGFLALLGGTVVGY